MPTYQYECQACGHGFDELQTMTDAKLKKCPKCHKNTLVRLIGSGSGMIFKGSGFYETDYKRKTGSKSDKKDPSKPASHAHGGANSPSTAPVGPCGRPCACHPN